MAATKSPETNSNINNNTNNINLNVKLDKPKRQYNKKKKSPDWITKTIIGALITLALTLIVYYTTNSQSEHKPPVVHDKSNAITGEKQ